MNPIQQILHTFPVIVLDGAMATELERYGCDLNDSLWSAKVLMEQPELIKRVHQDYFAAGADCAITASYQSTFEGFAKRGLSEAEARELIQASVKIAAEARDEFWQQEENRLNRPKPIVAASVGPYGAFLANGSEYTGQYDVTEEELMEFHRPRMKALIEAGADVLACETIPNLMEARAIARLLEEFEGAYAWITFSAKDDLHISSGTLISECARYLDSYEQVAALGVNCTPPQYISSLIKEIKSQTDKPVIVYPNSGEHYDAESKTWDGTSAGETYGCSAHSWYEAGAQLIGGCCRTTPDDIKGITKWARK
ncbi:homocysteine S-methyltransferase [Priestia megaterium]|uniref:homocysteine S-methyltransferase n=1 Tax=Priestia megaterium TaxID=1404 RepID=UPI0004709461|nr:homocysteine S-methyltransferase [Priestia megaterium]TCN14325.1 homocysteine S-methyltransferase [Bacillus sp. BK006]MCM3019304.1 homocysteine S-methyltransferase [Priestia megaterium]MCM3182199.1 homocysteine S-methyltransferase [Priestia megaterium]MCM3193864.1 homocysteine S-methyltransferase [Priestia megaterium]MED3915359.1 homocysteine S-methyltransferase [Priestia megaterium]